MSHHSRIPLPLCASIVLAANSRCSLFTFIYDFGRAIDIRVGLIMVVRASVHIVFLLGWLCRAALSSERLEGRGRELPPDWLGPACSRDHAGATALYPSRLSSPAVAQIRQPFHSAASHAKRFQERHGALWSWQCTAGPAGGGVGGVLEVLAKGSKGTANALGRDRSRRQNMRSQKNRLEEDLLPLRCFL